MPTTIEGFRIRVVDLLSNHSYLVRDEGKKTVRYYSAYETPASLSNLVDRKAAELRFQLEDAADGNEAAKAVRAAVGNDRIKITVL